MIDDLHLIKTQPFHVRIYDTVVNCFHAYFCAVQLGELMNSSYVIQCSACRVSLWLLWWWEEAGSRKDKQPFTFRNVQQMHQWLARRNNGKVIQSLVVNTFAGWWADLLMPAVFWQAVSPVACTLGLQDVPVLGDHQDRDEVHHS